MVHTRYIEQPQWKQLKLKKCVKSVGAGGI